MKQPIIHDDGTEGAIITKVYCAKTSVGYNEFYTANQQGFKPEIKLILPDYMCYSNEPYLTHEGTEYSVIRAYNIGEKELELTCERVNAHG